MRINQTCFDPTERVVPAIISSHLLETSAAYPRIQFMFVFTVVPLSAVPEMTS